MQSETIYPLPLSNNPPEYAIGADFSFIRTYGATMGAKHINYKPAEIYRGKKWYVYYSYWNPEKGKFKRFRVYEDINRLKGQEQEEFAELLKKAINYGLSKGFDPFEFAKAQSQIKAVKAWSLVQGLNYFKQNLVNRGLRIRSQKIYGSVLKFLYKYLSSLLNEDISKITKNQILTAFRKAQTERKWTNSTYNTYITFVRTIFNFLINEEILIVNPCQIKFLPETFKRHKYFSDDIFNRIKEESDPELLRFMMFLYHTGTRPNEAMQLKYENIQRDRKLLFIPAAISKNRKDGFVPLTDYVLENYQGEGLIFTAIERHYSRLFAKVKKKLKLPSEYTMYSIKATRAIHLTQEGVSIYFIMQLFRHSNPMTTMSYLRDIGANIDMSSVEKGIKF